MIGYILILGCTILNLAEGILIKKYNQKHAKGGFIFTALVSLFSMLFFLFKDILTDPTGLTFTTEMLPYAVVAGVLYCSASLLTYLALQYGSFAISMLILSYSLVITILYGLIFLNEPATAFTYIGFAVIAISLYLVRADSKGEEKKVSFKWLVCIIISTLGSGFFGVVQKMQQLKFDDKITNEFMVVCLGISALSLFVIGFIKDGKDCAYILKKGSPYAITAGLSNGANNMLGMILYTVMAISISSPTRAGVKTVVSFLVSYLIFKERFLKRQIIGVALGALGVVLLNLKL